MGAAKAAGYGSGPETIGNSDDDPVESEDRCNELELEVPGTIELQTAEDGPTSWRELQLGGSSDAPYWRPVAEAGADQAGWIPVRNLSTMTFQPPLAGSLKRGKPNYLAYAPANPQTTAEQDQLVALTMDFGEGRGSFTWNGRVYQYTLVNKLPCFPGPVAK